MTPITSMNDVTKVLKRAKNNCDRETYDELVAAVSWLKLQIHDLTMNRDVSPY